MHCGSVTVLVFLLDGLHESSCNSKSISPLILDRVDLFLSLNQLLMWPCAALAISRTDSLISPMKLSSNI